MAVRILILTKDILDKNNAFLHGLWTIYSIKKLRVASNRLYTVNVRKRNVRFGKPNYFLLGLKSFGSSQTSENGWKPVWNWFCVWQMEQFCSVFRQCQNPNCLTTKTICQTSKIRTFGFRTLTVFKKMKANY